MKTFRIIGDVHQKTNEYLKIAQGCDYSLQLGDMGFDYSHMNHLDENCHKFFQGNHDNYDWNNIAHNLGDFGTYDVPGFGDIFFIRGGFSLDWQKRTPGLDWWIDEELNMEKRNLAIGQYKVHKPGFVVTHECPESIVSYITDGRVALSWGYKDAVIKSQTNTMLQEMLEFHAPVTWIFGHYHRPFDRVINGTRFICLPELKYQEYQLVHDIRMLQ